MWAHLNETFYRVASKYCIRTVNFIVKFLYRTTIWRWREGRKCQAVYVSHQRCLHIKREDAASTQWHVSYVLMPLSLSTVSSYYSFISSLKRNGNENHHINTCSYDFLSTILSVFFLHFYKDVRTTLFLKTQWDC